MATPRTNRKKSGQAATPGSDAVTNPAQIEDAEVVSGSAQPLVEGAQVDAVMQPEPQDGAPITAPDDPPQAQTDTESRPERADPVEPEPEPEPRRTDPDLSRRDVDPAPVVAPRGGGGGFVALLLGGVAAAAIGFILARTVLPGGWPMPDVAALQAQLAAQDEKIAQQQAALEALGTPAPPVDIGPLTAEVADLRAALGALPPAPDYSADIAALADRVAATEQREPAVQTGEPADIGPVETAIAAIRAEIATIKADMTALQSATATAAAQAENAAAALAQAKADAASAEAEAADASAKAADDAKAVLLQATAAQLDAAVQNGMPFADIAATLVAEGVDLPAGLVDLAETGVPALATLVDAFDEPARAALEASLRQDMGETLGERLSSFLRTQTGARSLEPREGDDPDAVLSRVEAAVKAGDLTGALDQAAALPLPAQEALAPWVTLVQSRITALAASSALSAQLGER